MEIPTGLPEVKETSWMDNRGRLCMTGQYVYQEESLDQAEKNCPIKVGAPHPDAKEFKCVGRSPIVATNHPQFWLVRAEFIKGA